MKFLVLVIFLILFTLVWHQVTSHNRPFGSCRQCQCLSYRHMDKHGTRRGKERKTKGLSRLSDYNAGKNWDLGFCLCSCSLHLSESTSTKHEFGVFLSGVMEKPHATFLQLKELTEITKVELLHTLHVVWPLSELPNETQLQNMCSRGVFTPF